MSQSAETPPVENICSDPRHAATNLMLHRIVQRFDLSPWKKAFYEGPLVTLVRKVVQKASGDKRCKVHLEGSVPHGTSLVTSDADMVVRRQNCTMDQNKKRAIRTALYKKIDKDERFESKPKVKIGSKCIEVKAKLTFVEAQRQALAHAAPPQTDGAAAAAATFKADMEDSHCDGTHLEDLDRDIRIDILFEWASSGKLVNEREEKNPFEDKPEAMCAVKALKLMKSARAPGFSQLGGCKIESLVLWRRRAHREACKACPQSPVKGSCAGMTALHLLTEVWRAFLPEENLPEENLPDQKPSKPDPNYAVRMRHIEREIRETQRTVMIHELLDFGKFEACRNCVRYLISDIDRLVLQPLERELSGINQQQQQQDPADEQFSDLEATLEKILRTGPGTDIHSGVSLPYGAPPAGRIATSLSGSCDADDPENEGEEEDAEDKGEEEDEGEEDEEEDMEDEDEDMEDEDEDMEDEDEDREDVGNVQDQVLIEGGACDGVATGRRNLVLGVLSGMQPQGVSKSPPLFRFVSPFPSLLSSSSKPLSLSPPSSSSNPALLSSPSSLTVPSSSSGRKHGLAAPQLQQEQQQQQGSQMQLQRKTQQQQGSLQQQQHQYGTEQLQKQQQQLEQEQQYRQQEQQQGPGQQQQQQQQQQRPEEQQQRGPEEQQQQRPEQQQGPGPQQQQQHQEQRPEQQQQQGPGQQQQQQQRRPEQQQQQQQPPYRQQQHVTSPAHPIRAAAASPFGPFAGRYDPVVQRRDPSFMQMLEEGLGTAAGAAAAPSLMTKMLGLVEGGLELFERDREAMRSAMAVMALKRQ